MLQDLVNQIGEVLAPFEAHFERYGYATYDSSDIYETALGRRAKRAWEKDSKTAFLYAAPLVILDILFPQSRRLFAEMKVQPICLAQVGLAYLRLAEVRQDSGDRYLALARRCFSDLKYCARATRSGIGWGLNINWSTKSGYMPPLTPCHSQTAYVFELIACLNRIAPSEELLGYLERIVNHTAFDYIEFEEPTVRSRVTGYSVMDTRAVLNAQSYRLVILLSGYTLFRCPDYLDRALDGLEYLIRWQQKDGSWPYSPEERFVDGYHTCFILKNLFETSNLLRTTGDLGDRATDLTARLAPSIDLGYRYFLDRLLDGVNRPIPFAVSNKPVLYRYDAYDLAEALNLVSLFGDVRRVAALIKFFRTTMRLPSGLGRYRYYPGVSPILPGISYHRYANSAFFLAAANALHRVSIRP